MKIVIPLLALALCFGPTGSALAHDSKPSHGGIVQSADDLHFELVAKDAKPMIYIEDHGKKLSTAGASGKLIVLNGQEKTEFTLQPAQENALVANGDVRLKPGAKAIAAITFADKKNVTVRFSIK